MNRRTFLQTISTGALAAAAPPVAATPAPPRWNIVFVLMDDLGWHDLVPYGNRFIDTPNLTASQAKAFASPTPMPPARLAHPAGDPEGRAFPRADRKALCRMKSANATSSLPSSRHAIATVTLMPASKPDYFQVARNAPGNPDTGDKAFQCWPAGGPDSAASRDSAHDSGRSGPLVYNDRGPLMIVTKPGAAVLDSATPFS